MTDPGTVAAADQELAGIEQEVNALVAEWRALSPSYAAGGLDRMHSVAVFMLSRVVPTLSSTGSYAALAVAIERLAAK